MHIRAENLFTTQFGPQLTSQAGVIRNACCADQRKHLSVDRCRPRAQAQSSYICPEQWHSFCVRNQLLDAYMLKYYNNNIDFTFYVKFELHICYMGNTRDCS